MIRSGDGAARERDWSPLIIVLPAIWLVIPGLLHFPALFREHYFFYSNLLGNTATPGALWRVINTVWLLIGLGGGLLVWQRWRRPVSWIVVVLVGLAYLLILPFGSTDWLYYHDLGRVVAAGGNPYLDGFTKTIPFLPEPFRHEVVQFVPYPPLWSLVLGGLYRLTGGGLLAFALGLKVILAAGHGVNFFLVRKVADHLHPGSGSLAAWGYLLHPFFLFEALSQMHFDVLWLGLVLATFLLLLQGRFFPAALLFGLAVNIKYTALFGLPLFLPFVLNLSRRWWPIRLRSVAVPLAVAGVGALSLPVFGTWRPILDNLAIQAGWRINSLYSAFGLIWPVLNDHSRWLQVGLLGLTLVAVWRLIPVVRLHEPRDVMALTGLLTLVYLLVGSPVFWPWYALWPLFFMLTAGPAGWGSWRWLSGVVRFFAAMAFLYYPLVYLVGHVWASFDLRFQALYAALVQGVTLVMLLLPARIRTSGSLWWHE